MFKEGKECVKDEVRFDTSSTSTHKQHVAQLVTARTSLKTPMLVRHLTDRIF